MTNEQPLPIEKYSTLDPTDQEAIRQHALDVARDELRAEQVREKAGAVANRARAEAEKKAARTVQLAEIRTAGTMQWRLYVRGEFTFFDDESEAREAYAAAFASDTAGFMAGRL